MEQEEVVVYIKIFEKKGDIVFEGKVSTDVEPHEIAKLRCFREGYLNDIYNKATNEQVMSFKGLQNNVELVSRGGDYEDFSGVLYVGADDGVLRTSESVPSCECVMMTVWWLSHEECEKVFRRETLEELEIHWCKLPQIPKEIGGMKKLKNFRLLGLHELKFIPEEVGELSNLEELQIEWCGLESLPKRLNELKLRVFSLRGLHDLHLNAEDLVLFSKLRHLKIDWCEKVFTPLFAQEYWETIQSTTNLRVLEVDWDEHNHEMVVAALEENGSLVDGGEDSESYAHIFKRNKENHERTIECVVHMLAIRRWRDVLNGVPKEMVKMIAVMLWMMRCDVEAWIKR